MNSLSHRGLEASCAGGRFNCRKRRMFPLSRGVGFGRRPSYWLLEPWRMTTGMARGEPMTEAPMTSP